MFQIARVFKLFNEALIASVKDPLMQMDSGRTGELHFTAKIPNNRMKADTERKKRCAKSKADSA